MHATLLYFDGSRNTEHGQSVALAVFRHSYFYIGFLKVNENIKHENISKST
jgi:hypothetical protein